MAIRTTRAQVTFGTPFSLPELDGRPAIAADLGGDGVKPGWRASKWRVGCVGLA